MRRERKDDTRSRRRPIGKPRAAFFVKRKKCKFCMEKINEISYLDHQLLRKFTTERGKIIPSRFSGCCARHQRKLTNAIKRARHMGLLPFLAV